MGYFSIDLETSGLDPSQDVILEVGIVYDDLKSPLSDLKRLRIRPYRARISGEPKALTMNAALIEKIGNHEDTVNAYELGTRMRDFMLPLVGFSRMDQVAKVTAAGKNFGSFDLQFLKMIDNCPNFHHRCLDAGSMYWLPEDEVLPNMDLCLERAGFEFVGEKHDSVDDALNVVRLIRCNVATKQLLEEKPCNPDWLHGN
jgi:oligoribonuclease (3'-5' exoribonuclease)